LIIAGGVYITNLRHANGGMLLTVNRAEVLVPARDLRKHVGSSYNHNHQLLLSPLPS
jgi:hypothetical protein